MNFKSQKIEELVRINSHHYQYLISHHKSKTKFKKIKKILKLNSH
jgi:hypothetical protein